MLPGIYMDIDFYAKVDEELAKIPYCSPKCNYYMSARCVTGLIQMLRRVCC